MKPKPKLKKEKRVKAWIIIYEIDSVPTIAFKKLDERELKNMKDYGKIYPCVITYKS